MIERKFWDSFIKVFNDIDVITVPSNTAAKIIEYEGINKPIRVISNGLNLENFNININTSKIYEKFNIKKDCPVLTTVSRLEKEKRVDLLIEALGDIKSLNDFQFLVTGSGKEKNNLELLAESVGIKDRIIFTGQLSEKELAGIYKISDIYLSGSEVELQGLSIMEAMATGLPIIASRAMAVPELVLHGTNGFLFRPGDKKDASEKILKILNDKKLQKKMSVNSLELIKKHDFEITLDKFEQIYIEAAKNLEKISV
jgi:glycosyltransferase involved in cell wall biosynthesis